MPTNAPVVPSPTDDANAESIPFEQILSAVQAIEQEIRNVIAALDERMGPKFV